MFSSFSKSATQERLAVLADLLELTNSHVSDSIKAQAFIDYIRDLQGRLDLPTHFEHILHEHISELAKQSLHEARWNYPVPRYMQQHECEQLILALANPKMKKSP
ncbi:hypothetical protein QW180_25850 [Vibrio sinaloensis]|nr:hypothetical protein [Vibrio sinaloensis]